jgi:hypothetical protein
MAATPTSRSLAYCKKHGLLAGVVERWNPHAKIRQDLFGFIDLIVIDWEGVIGVQATSATNAASRIKKILEEPRAAQWLSSYCRIEVWSWKKKKIKRGGVAFRWILDRRPVTLKDFENEKGVSDAVQQG